MKYILPLVMIFLFFAACPASAVLPDEIMTDPVLEQRARAISKQLRCLVCQGEDIDESAAGLARDLRLLVRERLHAGDSDAEVLDSIQARYGDYVLMKPPVKSSTYLLWLTPVFVLAGGLFMLFRQMRFKTPGGG
ncbi:MAG TPA: cytochrome c-type biogenesis protein [Alphaproteobacteria bacterium]|nr:cytochrome c-type biogenesis protein [Alphaproteobacteria bacterium]